MKGSALVRLAVVAVGAALAFVSVVHSAPPAPSPASSLVLADANGPATKLQTAPRLARVRFDVAPGGAKITHELVFPKGALSVAATTGDPTIFLAFTAQARPLAISVTKHAVDADGKLVEAGGSPLPIADVFVRPASAAVVLGPPKGAGHVVKIPRGDAPFALRVVSAIPLETGAKTEEVSLMARLGVRDGAPIAIDRIEVAGTLGGVIRGARAILCGDKSDPSPLVVQFPGYPPTPSVAGVLDPAAAKRLATDDLCVDVLL